MTNGPARFLHEAPSGPFRILRPAGRGTPILAASPHSGRAYPNAFLAASRLDPHTLRRSEDCFVDDLLEGAASRGVTLLAADFPRAFCDVNRGQWELDPTMFADRLPAWCNTRSARVGAGFGTIARLVASGQPIYSDKLLFADAETRIRSCWQPYHAALSDLIDGIRTGHGRCILLDFHSMPIDEAPPPRSRPEANFILGDAHGTSCDPLLPRMAQHFLEKAGYCVRRNDPYAGGYVTRHYGRPRQGVHALQIEIGRSLYMNQRDYTALPSFAAIRTLMSALLDHLVAAATQIAA